MSMVKKSKILFVCLLTIISFVIFGCKNDTPVDDISFNLGEGQQIVLMVGQTLEMKDYVTIKPNYATNKKYTITSFDENIVDVVNNNIVAVSEGVTQIKVVSKDNSIKEDLMSVVVKKTKTTLSAPRLTYNNETQTVSFDAITYAASYTLKINNEEIDLGNSNNFNLSQYKGKSFDNLLSIQVKANAPSYSYAIETSSYSSEVKLYQAGSVKNIKVVGGTLSFDKTSSIALYNVYVNNELIVEGTSQNSISLKDLDVKFSNMETKVQVEAIVPDEIKEQYGDDVMCFNSVKIENELNVLGVPEVQINSSTLTWQNVAHADGYSVSIDGAVVAETSNNYFDLQTLANYYDVIDNTKSCTIKVVANLAETSENVAKTTKENSINVTRLSSVVAVCEGSNIVWEPIANATAYAFKLVGQGVELVSSTNLTALEMNEYSAGTYSFEIKALSKNATGQDVYYLPSKTAVKNLSKNEVVSFTVEDYVLKISNLGTDKAVVDFDVDAYDEVVNGAEKDYIDLNLYDFTADEHIIKVYRQGDANTIDSDVCEWTFTQLEKIESISINSGVVSVNRSLINANAVIELVTKNVGTNETFSVDSDEYTYNTTITPEMGGKNFLTAGQYSTEVYVRGDGEHVFSYRESGEEVVNAGVVFEVLAIPTSGITNTANAILDINAVDNAESYNIFLADSSSFVGNVEADQTGKSEFEFGSRYEFLDGEVSYSIQAVGDGVRYLDSAHSSAVQITRLKTPKLKYSNTNNVISKADSNSAGVNGYIFTHNDTVNTTYDFVSKFNVVDGDVFTLTAIAVAGADNKYYLNSVPYVLTLNKIENIADFEVVGLENVLKITPENHNEEYSLVLVVNNDETLTFATNGEGQLVCQQTGQENLKLSYAYSSGSYYISLIDANHNAIVEEMNNEFSVKVKFVKASTGEDTLINSEFSSNATLNLNIIDETTNISLNTHNQIVLTPTNHNQEYALTMVLNNGEELTFVSNGEGKLVCNPTTGEIISLDYSYSNGSYYIDILNEDYTSVVENLYPSFNVKVKYGYNHNNIETDLDSAYCQAKTIEVQSVATISRDGQTIKISNVKETYTYLNYTLLINDYVLELNSSAKSEDGFITFDVEYIYEYSPSGHIQEINTIAVVVNNVDSTNEKPILSMKGGEISIAKAQTVTLTSFKFNNNEDGKGNNSAVVKFAVTEPNYADKQYVVELYNKNGNAVSNKQTLRFDDSNESDGFITFNLDDVQGLDAGAVGIKAYVLTAVKYDGVEVFNSINSNEIVLEKVSSVTNLKVSDNVLTFNAVDNCVGYEVYKQTGTSTQKINQQLITANSYTLSNLAGTTKIMVKAISAQGYSNSAYSEVLTINQVSAPVISVVDGKFNVKFGIDILGLLLNADVKITPEIVNNTTGEVASINLSDLNENEIVLQGTTMIAEPYLFLVYNSASMSAEKLSLKIKVESTKANDDVYYLNSDVVEISTYGLFEPTNVLKTTNENNTVELITWTNNDKNILNSKAVSVGYVLKIVHNGKTEEPYYTSDSKLMYYDTESGKYVSYPKYLSTNSAIFPAGYDGNGDGKFDNEEFDILFGAGTYNVTVQTIPTETREGYNICSSQYSSACEFEIMATPVLSVDNGKVTWDTLAKANSYTVSIYEQNETEPIRVYSVNTTEFDFKNTSLNNVSGVCKVVVKAISKRDDTLNSAESAPLYVYRLPQANAVSVDDGKLVLTATNFFTTAEIQFVDTLTNEKFVVIYNNIENEAASLAGLKIKNWTTFDDDATINKTNKFIVNLVGEDIKIIDGRDYIINVTLKGNSNQDLGTISTSTTAKISNMTATKLKPNTTSVSLGVVKFMPDTNYVTISGNTYKQIVNMNYVFNNATASTFWSNTTVYKITVESSNVVDIYAVDYYSLITAISNNLIEGGEYELINDSGNLYAYVKYPYIVEGTTKYVYFNVYNENIINLRDYDYIYYYPTYELEETGVNKFESGTKSSRVDLSVGGSFAVSISMLGGDSYESVSQSIGRLTAKTEALKTFVRYGVNYLSSSDGKVKFDNMLQKINEKVEDSPIYRIEVFIAEGESQIFYIYHATDETKEKAELDAQEIANRHDGDVSSTATYIMAELSGDNNEFVIFDLSKYIDAGSYNVNIRTLAGLGTGKPGEADYLLNAKEPDTKYTFYKLADTEFVATSGILQFAQSYVSKDNEKIYTNKYDIELFDTVANETYVYSINANSDGVELDNSTYKVNYTLPEQLSVHKVVGEDLIAQNIALVGGRQYLIKIKACAADSYVLNGTYTQKELQDVTLSFEKSLGINEESFKIENGMLKWKVFDLDNYVNTIIKVSFLDENLQYKNIKVVVGNSNKVEIDGVYQYHYYQFTDEKYNLSGNAGSAQIVDKMIYNLADGSKEERQVVYTVSLYTVGQNTQDKNILNSNHSSQKEVTRLTQVDDLSIKTFDGNLTWLPVEDAVAYEIKFVDSKNNSYEYQTASTTLNLQETTLNLPVETYSISIRAIGNSRLTSLMSNEAEGFAQLGDVVINSIAIEGSNIVWANVENATGYRVEFNYTTTSGMPEIINDVIETNSFAVPTDISGTFVLKITAVGVGDGKEFNAKPVEFKTTTEAPKQVQSFEYDNLTSRFVIEVNDADFLTGDKLVIGCNFAEYISNTETKTPESRTYEISHLQNGYYEKINETTYRYYQPVTIIGKYTDIYVQVVRAGTVPSNTVEIDNFEFKLFAYGAGSFDDLSTTEVNEANPYRIATAEQLLNIRYFPGVNYELISSINMSAVDVEERLNNYGAIIGEEFSGTIDGKDFSIFGFNIDANNRTDTILVENVENFALFKNISDATIKNLSIGQENIQLILINTFAKEMSNVVKLSMIATGANNSTIENVDILNLKVVLTTDKTNALNEYLTNEVYVAGLINNASNTTIKGSTIKMLVEFDINVDANKVTYIAGAVANAINVNIQNSNINFELQSIATNRFVYVGGAVGYYQGNTTKATGITSSVANIKIENVNAIYNGGLVGFARYVTIDECEVQGSYKNEHVADMLYVGGIVGWAQSSTISNSGSSVEFTISVENITDKYIGVIVGYASIYQGRACVIENCYVTNYEYLEQSQISKDLINFGIYGTKDDSVSVTGCYKK